MIFRNYNIIPVCSVHGFKDLFIPFRNDPAPAKLSHVV